MARGGYLDLGYDLKRDIAGARGFVTTQRNESYKIMPMKIWQRESRGVAVLASSR